MVAWRRCWRCLPAAAAYLPPGFVGVSPQNRARPQDFELMREAGSTACACRSYWSAIEAEKPAGRRSPTGRGFDNEVELAAEDGHADLAVRLGLAGMGRPRTGIDLPVRQRLAALGLGRIPPRSGRAATGRKGNSGKTTRSSPTCRSPTGRSGTRRTSSPTPPTPTRSEYAKLIRISGRALHGADPGSKVIVGGLFGRPLQIPPNVASGDFLDRALRAGNVRPYFDGVALHPYVAEARGDGGPAAATCGGSCAATATRKAPLYITELGWGSDERPDPLAARPRRARRDQLSKAARNALRQPRSAGGSTASGGSPGPTKAASCQFCGSAGLLTAATKRSPPGTGSSNGPVANRKRCPKADGDRLDE